MKSSFMPAYINAIETALPPFATDQTRIADFMVRHLKMDSEEERKLRILYRASGIKERYSVLEDFGKNLNGQSFFKEGMTFPSAKPRMQLYQRHALKLALESSRKILTNEAVDSKSITHLITVSCTGMYAPGLDIELVEHLGLNTDVQRTSINFMGCYAAFNALKLADQIVSKSSDAHVLIVAVELCSIHLQEKKDEENLLANAIFGDGASAVLVSSTPAKRSLEITRFHNDLALGGKEEMGWFIGDYGFEMKLTPQVPDVIQKGIGELTERLLEKIQLGLDDISFFAIHPGGKRILEVIEEKLSISKDQNDYSRDILKRYGNMSSPTILFVLKAIMNKLSNEDHDRYILSFAFGPGLTLESAVLKTVINV
jgi:predicted naringenin-chalcone synthase